MERQQVCPCCLLVCLLSIYTWRSVFSPGQAVRMSFIHLCHTCLALYGQLFVQSVYYLYSMCTFVLVQLLALTAAASLMSG